MRRAPRKEIGWLPVEFTPEAADDPLLAPCGREQVVFHWHGDTYDLPAAAVRLAGTEICPQQAFRWGPRAWGLQFHLEVTSRIIDDWLAVPGMALELTEVDDVSAEQIRKGTRQHMPPLEALARRVFLPFAETCLAVAKQEN